MWSLHTSSFLILWKENWNAAFSGKFSVGKTSIWTSGMWIAFQRGLLKGCFCLCYESEYLPS